MSARGLTAYDSNAPMCEKQNGLAVEMLAAGREIAVFLHQPGDNEASYRLSALVQALQTLIGQAVKTGLTDEDVFKVLAASLGWAATRQTLGPIRDWVGQLHEATLTAAQMCLTATGDFETRGQA